MERAAAVMSVVLAWAAVASAQPADQPAPGTSEPPAGAPAPPSEQGTSRETPQQGTPPPPPGGAPSSASSATPSTRSVAVVDAATYGIDPVVGEHVTAQVRATAAELGYRVLDREATVQAAQRARMAYPPSPADLWRATYAAGADRGVFGRAWADQGHYVVELMVASLDGTGPFFARGTAGADDLHAVVDKLVREALPPPTAWDAEGAARWSGRTPEGARGGAAGSGPGSGAAALGTPSAEGEGGYYDQTPPGEQPPGNKRRRPPTHRFELALQTEAAVGTTEQRFYNHLLGLRVGYRFTEDTLISAYLAYANLEGRTGRVGNLLVYAELEHRIQVSSKIGLSIPLRFAVGYLPYNGPVVRVAGGLNFAVSDRVELGVDLLAPTFWVLRDETVVSLDVAAEVVLRL